MNNSLNLFDDNFDEIDNPLDTIENVLNDQSWSFDRRSEDELRVTVKGKCCEYRLYFIWESDMRAVQFCAQYDLTIPEDKYEKAGAALLTVNEKLWMGHFDIHSDSFIPTFRYTSLLIGNAPNHEHFNEIIQIAMTQCERFFPTFHLLSQIETANDDTLPLALMETQGIS